MLHIVQKLASRMGLTMVRCPVCGVITDKTGDSLCPDCTEKTKPRTGGYCPQCGVMFGANDDPPTLCAQCRHEPPPWDSLHFYGEYTGTLRDQILSYKFNNGFGRTHLLANMACRAFDETAARIPDVIIPVPLHTRRLLWRGFNQSTELARMLGEKLNKPVLANGLTRTRHTRPQTRLGLAERQNNIKGAFAAEPDTIQGTIALIVDDVYTTGSTLSECARTLKRAGAAGVDVLVLARAQ